MNETIKRAGEQGKVEGLEFCKKLKIELAMTEDEFACGVTIANGMMSQVESFLVLLLSNLGPDSTTKVLTYVFKFQLEGARRACEIAKETNESQPRVVARRDAGAGR